MLEELNINLDSLKFILLIIFASFTVIQLFYYLFFYLRLVFYRSKKKDKKKEMDFPPVSVVIAAKNEANNLESFLPTILTQEYENFEVIVVNDCSEDDTDVILNGLSQKYSNLRVTTIPHDSKFSHGKKLALTIGIKAVKNEIIVFTDADCYVNSKQWLKSIVRNYAYKNRTKIVLGYGAYSSKFGILNKLIRHDTFFIAMNYLSFALSKIPYMGVGRNLSYEKQLFFDNKGYASHMRLLSGDDDLFINEVANKRNTTIEISKKSITYSEPKSSFANWLRQKRRHYTTSKYYKFKHKFLLGLEPFSRFFFYLSFFTILFIYPFDTEFFREIFLARFVIQIIIFFVIQRKLNEKNLLIYSLFFDLFQPFINLLILIPRKRKKKNQW